MKYNNQDFKPETDPVKTAELQKKVRTIDGLFYLWLNHNFKDVPFSVNQIWDKVQAQNETYLEIAYRSEFDAKWGFFSYSEKIRKWLNRLRKKKVLMINVDTSRFGKNGETPKEDPTRLTEYNILRHDRLMLNPKPDLNARKYIKKISAYAVAHKIEKYV